MLLPLNNAVLYMKRAHMEIIPDQISMLPDCQCRPSDAEVAELLQKTERLYEESMRVANLTDVSQDIKDPQPRYAWDDPIGLVVTK